MQRLDVRYCIYMYILSNLCHVSIRFLRQTARRPVGLCTSLHTYAASLLRLDTQSANDGRSAHLSSNRRRSHSPGHRLTSELQGTRAKIIPLWFCAMHLRSSLCNEATYENLWNISSNLFQIVTSWSPASIGSSNPGSGATFEFGPFLLPQKQAACKKSLDFQARQKSAGNNGTSERVCLDVSWAPPHHSPAKFECARVLFNLK